MDIFVMVICVVVGMLVGAAGGFFFARKRIEKELKENPPINEKMIRAMFMQMGRKPSEAQIRSIMKSVEINK